MNVTDLHIARGAPDSAALSVGLTFQHELYDLADTVVKTRAIRTLQSVAARYPIHRTLRCAARRKLEDVFDDLALKMGLPALRLDETSLLLDGPGLFIQAEGRRKADYCSCVFALWTDTKEHAEELCAKLLQVTGERYASEHHPQRHLQPQERQREGAVYGGPACATERRDLRRSTEHVPSTRPALSQSVLILVRARRTVPAGAFGECSGTGLRLT